MGILINKIDDENVGVMKYFLRILSSFSDNFEYVDVSELDFKYKYISKKKDHGGHETYLENYWYNQ